jgi:putative ABC transport system permease protein
MKKYFGVAWKNVVRHRRRSIPAATSIAAGVAALMIAAGFIEWGLWYGREAFIHSGVGHIRLVLRDYETKGLSDPFAYLMPEGTSALQAIMSTPEVRMMAPKVTFSGLISKGETTISFIGEGVAPDKERSFSRGVTFLEGAPLDERDPPGVIMGQGLAANLGAKPGDTVVLLANTASGGINAVEAQVRGIFATVLKGYDDTVLRVPISVARQLLKVSGAHSYALLLDDTSHAERVLASLRQRFAGSVLEFVPWRQLSDFYRKTEDLFSRQVDVVRAIIGAIIVLSISNSMMMAVMERTSEIGTSMALGLRRSAILRLFLCEGLLLGSIGGLAGVAIGFALAALLSAIGIPMPPAPGMAFGYTAEVRATWPIALNALILAVLTALAASVYPAWKASRMQIVDALRQNR